MIGPSVLAAALVLYALVAARLDRWSITAPMLFIVVGAAIGPEGADLFDVTPGTEAVKALAEVTLALLLFADAATIRLADVEGDAGLPTRLLVIGLPLTIVAGAASAVLVFGGIGWAAAALIASILAPTDAALGLGIFSDRSVPVRIRRTLNVESGLNDGIATPFVTLFLAVVISEAGSSNWVGEAAIDLALAVVVAVVVGGGGGWVVRRARRAGWMTDVSDELAVLALALLSYTGAIAVGGNGFVAAFAGGLLFGALAGRRFHEALGFTERIGLFGSFMVWAIFGAIFVAPVLADGPRLDGVAYAVLSLTVVRMLPVAIAMTRSGMGTTTLAFMGWFGPRGLASVVFTLIAFEAIRGEPAAGVLVEVATLTILLSVVLHGLSAKPLAAAYGRHLARVSPKGPEFRDVPEPRIRRSLWADDARGAAAMMPKDGGRLT
jgi:sodium/hydrogen antiporter